MTVLTKDEYRPSTDQTRRAVHRLRLSDSTRKRA